MCESVRARERASERETDRETEREIERETERNRVLTETETDLARVGMCSSASVGLADYS